MGILEEIRARYGLSKRALAETSGKSIWAVKRSLRKPVHRVTLGELRALCQAINKAPAHVLPWLRRIPRPEDARPPDTPA